VPEHNVDNLTITLGPGAKIKGHLVAVGGDLPNRTRIQFLSRGSNGVYMNSTSPVTADADGAFEIPDVQPGNYEVMVNQAFTAPSSGQMPTLFFTSTITVNNQDVTESGVTVPEGAASLEVTVTLDSRSGTITGTTLDADNHSLPGATIAVLSADSKKRTSTRYFRWSRSSPQGTFTLPGLIPGDYLLLLWPGDDNPGMVTDPDVIELVEQYCARVSVSPSGTVSQELRLSPAVQAIVRSFQ
jgi:hypothetical protein